MEKILLSHVICIRAVRGAHWSRSNDPRASVVCLFPPLLQITKGKRYKVKDKRHSIGIYGTKMILVFLPLCFTHCQRENVEAIRKKGP